MRVRLNQLVLLLVFSVLALGAWAVVGEYSFASATGTYTEISGGTVLGTTANDDESFNAIPLGFTFTYNGVNYTEISIQTDAFIAFGPTVLNSTLAISSATGTNNVVAALNRDLMSRTDGELSYLLTGTAPNRVFIVQWKNYRRIPTSAANDVFNFQIQFKETENTIVFAYGSFSVVNVTTAQTVQVGLRGDSNADYNNRTTTTDWTATTAGTANNATCRISDTVHPPLGLLFTFTPPQTGTPPLPAQNPVPANSATNVAVNTNLSWTSGGGTVTGYKVFFGTDNPPTNIVNGTTQTGTAYDPVNDLAYSTTYYWKIVPYNTVGDAIDCPVWQFTTLADPTITTYPYLQNFDTVTPPALPLGWSTINANNDAYTWETYAGNADTPPNSARIRYSTTVAMDDWLVFPPIACTTTPTYRLTFSYRANSATYPEALSVYWGTAPNAASMTHLLFENTSITNVTYTQTSAMFTVPANGTYYIGFHGHSPVDMFYLYIDSITLEEIFEFLNPPTNLTATVINNNTAHLSWNAPAPAYRVLNGYKVYRDGTLIATLANPATLIYDDPALALGTYSYTVTAYYTTGESVPAGPVSVTIVPPLNPPTNLTGTVTGNDVTLNWVSPEAPPAGQWITWCNDVLGNSVGTNGVVTFDVAHRFEQSDLTAVAGGTIAQVKFVPAYANCVYTVKVWTGGSAAGAGTLVSSQVVTPVTLDEWNLCVLNTPVPVPTAGDLYVGYECNTQGGYPAGCDAGPQIEGKGNMMYFGGEWATLTELASSLTYNWLIQTFVTTGTAQKAVELTPIQENRSIAYSQAPLGLQTKELSRIERVLTGFKVYRDGTLIGTINDPSITTYTDLDLPNATYLYGVSAVYSNGESVPATTNVTVNFQLAPAFFTDGFETYPNFAMQFAPWTLLDVDLATTYGFEGIDFPGSGEAMAYIIFTPSATTPPITTLTPHGGAKMAASFCSTTPPNNDWMIAPNVHLGTGSALRFYARSHNSTYGLERFRVGISTLPTIIPQGFQYITGPNYVEAPVNWTEYVYDLSAYDNQNVWIGIRCVSNNAFVFYVDDVTIHANGGSVGNDDPGAPAIATELKGNYPNPFNPSTTISFSVKEAVPVEIGIYNVKGQLVKTLVNGEKASGSHSIVWDGRDNSGQSVSSGVYYYKMNAGKYSSTRKMILMK